MATPRRNRYLVSQFAMLLAVAVVLAVLGSLSVDLFFFVALLGFLGITELTEPFKVVPAWRVGLRRLGFAGLVVFGVVVVVRTVRIVLAYM